MPQRKYRIEYLSTEGWGLYDPEYTKMERADCAAKLEQLMEVLNLLLIQTII